VAIDNIKIVEHRPLRASFCLKLFSNRSILYCEQPETGAGNRAVDDYVAEPLIGFKWRRAREVDSFSRPHFEPLDSQAKVGFWQDRGSNPKR